MHWPLHAIERPCRGVPGALKRLLLVDPDELEQQPQWGMIPTVAELVFKTDKAAYLFEQDVLSGQLVDDTDTGNDAGDIFTYQLTATFKKIRLEVEFLRSKLRNRRVHVIATYMDDTRRFVPYMRLKMKSDSGDRRGRNGYTLSGTCRLDGPAPLLDAELNIIYPDGTTVTPPGDQVTGVNTVDDTTTASTYIYTVPAGKWLLGVWLKSDAAQTVSLGLSAGQEDLGGTLGADANGQIIFQLNNLRPVVDTPIYLSGLAGNNQIEIWLLG